MMTKWQKPSFEDLAMNAEIGGYQADNGDGEREEPPFVQHAQNTPNGSRVAYLVAEFLESHWANKLATGHG